MQLLVKGVDPKSYSIGLFCDTYDLKGLNWEWQKRELKEDFNYWIKKDHCKNKISNNWSILWVEFESKNRKIPVTYKKA